VLEDISAGKPVRRRDAVTLARAVLESEVVRAAEAVLEADDATLLTRLVEMLQVTIESAARRNPTTRRG
jgi:hypothetical protein